MDSSMPGFPVPLYLLEFAQVQVYLYTLAMYRIMQTFIIKCFYRTIWWGNQKPEYLGLTSFKILTMLYFSFLLYKMIGLYYVSNSQLSYISGSLIILFQRFLPTLSWYLVPPGLKKYLNTSLYQVVRSKQLSSSLCGIQQMSLALRNLK